MKSPMSQEKIFDRIVLIGAEERPVLDGKQTPPTLENPASQTPEDNPATPPGSPLVLPVSEVTLDGWKRYQSSKRIEYAS